MSADSLILKIKLLRGSGIVLAAARHNRRAIAAELGVGSHIDAARTSLNYRLAGPDSPEEVAENARQLLLAAGVGNVRKVRKDAIRAIELVFSLPAGDTRDERPYFTDCVKWVATRFGGKVNILLADVHLDEGAPHCHVLVLPLRDGRLVGSEMLGGPPVFRAHLASFEEIVGRPNGLVFAAAKLKGKRKTDAAAAVLRELRRRDDPALHSAAWALVDAGIRSDPAKWMVTLGLELPDQPPKRERHWSDTFISPGKGPKKEPDRQNPIGFASCSAVAVETEPYAL